MQPESERLRKARNDYIADLAKGRREIFESVVSYSAADRAIA